MLFPYLQADFFIFKIVRDRIANHQQVNITLAHQTDLFSLAGEPPIGDPRCRYDRLVLRRRESQVPLAARRSVPSRWTG